MIFFRDNRCAKFEGQSNKLRPYCAMQGSRIGGARGARAPLFLGQKAPKFA